MAILILLKHGKYFNYIFQSPYQTTIIKDKKKTKLFVKISINFYVDVYAAFYIRVTGSVKFQHNSLQSYDFSKD